MFKEFTPELRQDANVGIQVARLLRRLGVNAAVVVRDDTVQISTVTMADARLVEQERSQIGQVVGSAYGWVHTLPTF